MKRESIEYAEFYHKTTERLYLALQNHYKWKQGKINKEEAIEGIKGCKVSYIEFLEDILDGRLNIDDIKITHENIKLALEKARFDWLEYELLTNYTYWYITVT